MSKPQSRSSEICPLCKRPKEFHTPEELRICMKKLKEFKEKLRGAGIQ